MLLDVFIFLLRWFSIRVTLLILPSYRSLNGDEVEAYLHSGMHFFFFLVFLLSSSLGYRPDFEDKEYDKVVQTAVKILGLGGSVASYDVWPPFVMRFLPGFITGTTQAEAKRKIVHDFVMVSVRFSFFFLLGSKQASSNSQTNRFWMGWTFFLLARFCDILSQR